MSEMSRTRIAQQSLYTSVRRCILLLPCLAVFLALPARADDREQFRLAWKAANRGDRTEFSVKSQGLEKYILYPYLVYEDLRHRRGQIKPSEMASFLERHEDWAFTAGLRDSWLRTLGKQGDWNALARFGSQSTDIVIRCLYLRSRIETGKLDGVLKDAQALWLAGKSQPSECDPVFTWLMGANGITGDLAWQRIRLAMLAGNSRFTVYLARFIPAEQLTWLQSWQSLHRTHYRNLDQAGNWPDNELTRMIVDTALLLQARQDADRAWKTFQKLDGHFTWDENTRAGILREIALQLAVAISDDALLVLAALPASHRDEQILQWWARVALVKEDWQVLDHVIEQMPLVSATDGRWRYWKAMAREKLGDPATAGSIRGQLASESSYYGFLAADQLNLPYTICPVEPQVTMEEVAELRQLPGIARSLELRAAGLDNWALSEWTMAIASLDIESLRTAAALAHQENWHDRVIFALGNSGDQRYYEWRFPLLWTGEVGNEAIQNKLDPSWVYGVMRSESALAETARSSAGALGLMQVTPATASRLARRHGLKYRGSDQLKEAESNIRFGTRFMRELLDRYNNNPVLVSGAYNAGPAAVDRWLSSRPRGSAAVWIESIPYYETRDYIPRVLAFTAIYDWRLNQPVTRISSRMPDLDSGSIKPLVTTKVVCSTHG